MELQKDFFNTVLADDGLRCIVGIMADKSEPVITRFFDKDDDEIYDCIKELDDSQREVYFGAFTFEDSKNPRRLVRTTQSVKSFFLDLDFKDGAYSTVKEATKAIESFVRATGLPMPLCVKTGHGIHVYWLLDEVIDYPTWKPIADAFKRKVRQLNITIDPTVSADGARILRVPGAHNTRYPPEKILVEIYSPPTTPVTLDDFARAVGYIEGPKFAITRGDDPIMDKLMQKKRIFRFSRIMRKSQETLPANIKVEEEYEITPGVKAIRLVTKKIDQNQGCAQLAYCVANRESLYEPMWFAALSIAQFCEDRVEAIPAVSKGYPGAEPDSWFETASRTVAPNTCAHFRSMKYPELCSECPHAGKIHTPISLGAVIEEAAPEDNIITVEHETLKDTRIVEIPNTYPFPWIRPKNGGVALRGNPDITREEVEDSDPDEVLVYEYDLWMKGYSDDGEQKLAMLALRLPNAKLCEFTAPFATLAKNESLLTLLASKGVHVAAFPKRLELLKRYLAAWLRELEHEGKPQNARTQFGWTENNSFVIGNREITTNGEIEIGSVTKSVESVARIYSPQGELSEWQRVANTYGRPGNEARAFALFCSFGAPLYCFVGEGSMLVHLTNMASGVGKSTAQKLVTSVWGNPKDGMLVEHDTVNAKLHRAGILHNLPVVIDEITNMQPEYASRFAFEINSGRGKNRMKSAENIERLNTTTWETIFITSGNNSLYDVMKLYKSATEGEMMRILEVSIPADKEMDKSVADELFSRTLPYNYGLACEPYMQYVVANRENVIKQLVETQQTFDKLTKMNEEQKERFFSACIACAMTGGQIANQLGIIEIPVAPVLEWAKATLFETRETVKGAIALTDNRSCGTLVSDYWNAILPNILVLRGGTPVIDERLTTNQMAMKPVIGSLKGRYEVEEERLYLAANDFTAWLMQKRISSTAFFKKMASSGILLEQREINLGNGTAGYSTAPVSALVVDVAQLQS